MAELILCTNSLSFSTAELWKMDPPKGEASFLEDYKMNWFQIYPALLFSLPLVFQAFSFPKKIPEQIGIYKTAFYILVLYTMNKVSYYRDYHIQFICRHSGFSMMEGGGIPPSEVIGYNPPAPI